MGTIKIISFLLLWILAPHTGMTFAQDSIFDEGVDTTIRAEDIGDDVRMWAQNTALKLIKALEDIKSLPMPQKKEALVSVIKDSVTEAQGKIELLLMRVELNRALTLSTYFLNQNPALSVNYVLLPAIKKAISLYEESDLPFLEANKDKPQDTVIPPPCYAAFTKDRIDFILTASNMNKSLEGQFEILKSAVVWIANDIIRSSETKRNPINARLILALKQKEEELKTITSPTYQINNSIRKLILKTKNEIVVETPPPPKACTDTSINLINAPIGFKCMTSKGVIFERVKRELAFGNAWKDLNTDLIWSDDFGRAASYDLAINICPHFEAKLPSKTNFETAEAHGFREVLAHINNIDWYWTSSSDPYYIFVPEHPQCLVIQNRDLHLYTSNYSVRCVAQ